MLDTFFVSSLVETVYGFSPAAINPIQRYTFDWRGIFSLLEENGQHWVLRLLKHPYVATEFHTTATLLDWLNQRRYPVPHIRRTRDQQLIGIRDNWALLLLSFIEGEVITPEPANLRLLGARLGQLHVLPHHSAPAMRLSRCHPETIATYTIPQLTAGSKSTPEAFMRLFKSLIASMNAIIQMEHVSLGITHGDCWYMNAIKADAYDVRLIDWDNVGLGAPVLDLGYLLLSSHFRLESPLSVKPDRDKVREIMEGYQGHYHLGRDEVQCLLPAVQFLLAYQLGEYYENHAPLTEEDPVLTKLQQRFNSTETIAQMAKTYAINT